MSDWGPENAIWDDGEWVSWDSINSHLARLEFEARFPDGDYQMEPVLRDLLNLAQNFFLLTDRHLSLYGDIGEIFGAAVFGLKLNRLNAQGSDGRIGDDLVEVKTITPFKKKDVVRVKVSGNFNKLLVVKVSEDFEVSGKLLSRAQLGKPRGKFFTIRWSDVSGDAKNLGDDS